MYAQSSAIIEYKSHAFITGRNSENDWYKKLYYEFIVVHVWGWILFSTFYWFFIETPSFWWSSLICSFYFILCVLWFLSVLCQFVLVFEFWNNCIVWIEVFPDFSLHHVGVIQ
jgi:hypothetical protein